MKTTIKYLTPLLLISACSISAFSADEPYKETPSSRNLVLPQRADSTRPLNRPEMLGPTEKASIVIGMTVYNHTGEKLGKVEEVVLDLSSGRVVSYVISSGGFLGMNEELSVVPPAAFRFDAEKKTAHLDITKEELAAKPHFKSSEWPTHDEAYVRRTYEAFGYQPYFGPLTPPEVDNTARNAKDDVQLSPLDHGRSEGDVDITRRIRKEILSDKSLSANAHNVKIITIDGRVTLRGPVETEAEKRAIESIAQRVVQANNVENQLEAKSAVNR